MYGSYLSYFEHRSRRFVLGFSSVRHQISSNRLKFCGIFFKTYSPLKVTMVDYLVYSDIRYIIYVFCFKFKRIHCLCSNYGPLKGIKVHLPCIWCLWLLCVWLLSLFWIKYEAVSLLPCSIRQCVTCSLRLSAKGDVTDVSIWEQEWR